MAETFRTGGSHGEKEGRKEGAGGMDDDATPQGAASPSSRSSSSSLSGASAAVAEQPKGGQRGDTVWYVEHQPPEIASPKPDPTELSSLPSLTSSGLQSTVLAALQQTDPGNLFGGASDDKEMPTSPEKRLGKTQPKGTVVYKVKASDTLARIAAIHDITPSMLQKLNKMTTRMVFAGQELYIPDPEYVPSEPPTPESTSPPVSPTTDTRPKLDVPLVRMADRPPEKVPGHAMKIPSPPNSATLAPSPHPPTEEEARRLDQECFERFLKVNSKYITKDTGTVMGILLVTPNAIMFEPEVMDKLVEEHGRDAYNVTLFMDAILCVGLYYDISYAAGYFLRAGSDSSLNIERPVAYRPDLRPRAASTSSLLTASAGNAASIQKIVTSQSASPPADSGEKKQSDEQLLDSQAAAVPGESSTDVEPKDSEKAMQDEGAIDFVDTGAKRGGDTDVAVTVEGAQTGETTTDTGTAETAAGDERAVSPLISFDEPAPMDVGKDSGKSVSGGVCETSDSSKETVSSSQQPGQPVAGDTMTGSTVPTADDLLGGTGLDILQTAPLTATDQQADSEGASAAEGRGQHSSSDDVFSEKLSMPIQETAGGESVGTDATESAGPGAETGPRPEGGEDVTTTQVSDSSGKDADGDTGAEKEGRELKEGEEMRIGNIVYLPVEESSTGEMVVRSTDNTPTPSTAPEPIPLSEDSKAKDSVDGEETGSPKLSGSFSPLRSSAQHLSNFVNYATGLFRSTTEDRKDVQDTGSGTPEQKRRTWSLKEKPTTPKPEVRRRVVSGVKMEERPELFQDVKNLISQTDTDDHSQPPFLLHLKVDIAQNERRRLTSDPQSHKRPPSQLHYLFSIPQNRVDNLYAFFIHWRPEIYDVDTSEEEEESTGFVLVDKSNVEDDSLNIVEEYFTGSPAAGKINLKKDWELISREEVRRRQSSADTEPPTMPDMSQDSTIMTRPQVMKLADSLPPRTIGYMWNCVYSTAKHGFSLKRLYRDVARIDSPILLVVQDTSDVVFGAYISHPPKPSDHFYGNGTSLLFTFKDGLQVFNWCGINHFIMKGNEDSFCVGAGHGQFGLWLDGDLYHGRSHRCSTFGNCVLSSEEDFLIKAIEAWAFE